MDYNCSYCGHDATITEASMAMTWQKIAISRPDIGDFGLGFACVTCPNPKCKKLRLVGRMTAIKETTYPPFAIEGELLQKWQLLPESEAKALPDYIPQTIREDYYEACRIRDLSPKGSATLSRRCLQGMIRDFHKIVKPKLIEEVNALKDVVDQETWDSIDAVRELGNIGAHMEKDINVIVDVDPEEAQLLISLIEQLIEDWYTAREERVSRAKAIKEAAANKKAMKKSQP